MIDYMGKSMKGKIIVIEGTDCSGKETQSKLLVQKLNENNIDTRVFSFPCYNTATGKIVAGPVLGKKDVSASFFEEGQPNVDSKITSLYYAADRKYNINEIKKLLDNGTNVVLDRYVYSNMAFQGAKFKTEKEKLDFFEWVEKLEFELLELPRGDINIFLHMDVDSTIKLLSKREEEADDNERNQDYLRNCEQTYFLLANKYNFKTIECTKNEQIKSIEEINDELLSFVLEKLQNN